MGLELEYTFLAARIPEEARAAPPVRIVDVYIPEKGPAHPRLRARQAGQRFELTKKTRLAQDDASALREETIELDEGEFAALTASNARRVVKDRHTVTLEGFPAEVDVFAERLAGLVLIDFEFPHEAARASFRPPAVCLADVTQEDFLAGGVLAGKSFADIAPGLERLGYAPLR
ncbi:hypothetical protein GCM10012320_32820 [Sinomonas cellulolyticus]|uniref:CYTH domain-containing protein n=1 Tax=Sinomonas cellulolyticus TaxID=2801916 RepID=A0ABS1K0Z8_9MICC|nr:MULTISPECIES: hypothetical protein [Sinomonas]MBL0703976.1 hypothetical protein [Sinomonas cellulolyticus]GHG58985.1 hypothetical protein GCM10012320_32820 [Sinomonas sp. KCTC 49339]